MRYAAWRYLEPLVMPRRHGCSDEVKSANIRELRASGRPQDQAVAIAMKWAREDCKKAKGKLKK